MEVAEGSWKACGRSRSFAGRVRGLAPADGRDDRRRRPAGRERRLRARHGGLHVLRAGRSRVIASGETKSSIVTSDGLQVDLRVVPLECWGAAMIYFTGSKAHNIRIREMAVREGLKLNEYGLFDAEDGALIAAETEEQVYERLGLPYIEPTLREDRGEVEAALARNAARPADRRSRHPGRPAHAHGPHRRAGAARARWSRPRRAAVRVLRGHRPCAEPVHAADDRREDARPAERAPDAPIALPEDDAAARHGAQHRSRRERRLGTGVPGGVRRLRCLGAFALHTVDATSMTRRVVRAIENPHVNVIGHLTTGCSGGATRSISTSRPSSRPPPAPGTALEINSLPGSARPPATSTSCGPAPRREVRRGHRLATRPVISTPCATGSPPPSAAGSEGRRDQRVAARRSSVRFLRKGR